MDLDGVEVNGKKAVGSISSVIDTGTTLIIGDKKNVAAVCKKIPGAAEASTVMDSTPVRLFFAEFSRRC